MKTYYVKQKISLNDKYYVYDTNDKPHLEIISNNKLLTVINRLFGSIFTLGNEIYVKYIDGKEVMTIKKKSGFFKEEYDFYITEDKIASLKQHMTSMKPKISIVTKNDTYLIEGDLMARSFTISKNDICIAHIKKSTFDFKDSYQIDILKEKEELMCISFLIAIDNSMHS